LTKGDARPLWKPHLVVPTPRGGVNDKYIRLNGAIVGGFAGAVLAIIKVLT
jgi:hypothetical protein